MCSLSRLSCLGFISDFTLCQQGFIDFLVMSIESANSASVYVPPGHVKRLGKLLPNQNAKLKDQFHEVARFKYLSGRTEGTYWQWVVRFLKFHKRDGKWTHPKDVSPQGIAEFLSDLASRLSVAAATQAQAFCSVES